jgi:LacI family transcriptional regulator
MAVPFGAESGSTPTERPHTFSVPDNVGPADPSVKAETSQYKEIGGYLIGCDDSGPETGRKRAMRPSVRITDVAALAGVSAGTASKALNNTGQLSQETRARVRRAAAQLGFTPDARGRALSSGRTYTVALLTTDSSGRFSIPIMRGVEDVLSAGELATVLCDTRDDPLREQSYLRSLVARGVDGIVVTGRRTEPRPPIDVPLPVVYALAASTNPDDASVIVDDAAGAGAAITHLLGLGRSRIAHVTGLAHHRSAAERAHAVAATAGPALCGEPLFGEWTERWGRQATDLVLRQDPDAICCGSDQIARGVCDRLRELGRPVPDDIAVTGYDNWPMMALASRPPLTSVDLRLEDLGRRSANLLLDAIAGIPHRGVLELPTQLVTRESTLGS